MRPAYIEKAVRPAYKAVDLQRDSGLMGWIYKTASQLATFQMQGQGARSDLNRTHWEG